jgi:hypothetical protein
LGGSQSVQVFYCLFIHTLPLEIQLSRGEGWDSINRFNPATLLCLSQAYIICLWSCLCSVKMRSDCSSC